MCDFISILGITSFDIEKTKKTIQQKRKEDKKTIRKDKKKDKRTTRDKYKTKTTTRVLYCDVGAVSHSCYILSVQCVIFVSSLT